MFEGCISKISSISPFIQTVSSRLLGAARLPPVAFRHVLMVSLNFWLLWFSWDTRTHIHIHIHTHTAVLNCIYISPSHLTNSSISFLFSCCLLSPVFFIQKRAFSHIKSCASHKCRLLFSSFYSCFLFCSLSAILSPCFLYHSIPPPVAHFTSLFFYMIFTFLSFLWRMPCSQVFLC